MKYIDTEKLKEALKKHYTDITVPVITAEGGLESFFRRCEIKDTIKLIDSLQQEQPDDILIPKWCLENIENTLRIQHNINNDAKDGETCQDRNIKESLNCIRKLLNGEEITGRERSEPLMKQPEVDLEKEIHKKVLELHTAPCYDELTSFARHFYELGKFQQERPKVDLEKFTKKMDDWKARFNRPDDIPIKATMAFTARMFYMYPDIAREWYENLPKATQD